MFLCNIVRQLANEPRDFALHAEVLPTSYTKSGTRIRALMHEIQPDYVVALGVANGRKHINLERFAVNINDASIADTDDDLRQGVPIVPNAPPAYRASLPLEALYTCLNKANIPVRYSNHAGAYVCNHLMYTMLHNIAQAKKRGVRAGFIHVPMMREAQGEKGADVGLPLTQMIDAVRLCLQALAQTQPDRG